MASAGKQGALGPAPLTAAASFLADSSSPSGVAVTHPTERTPVHQPVAAIQSRMLAPLVQALRPAWALEVQRPVSLRVARRAEELELRCSLSVKEHFGWEAA